MNEGMIAFQVRRREELKHMPFTRATGTETNGIGSRGNTQHLNLTRPLIGWGSGFNAIPPRKK